MESSISLEAARFEVTKEVSKILFGSNTDFCVHNSRLSVHITSPNTAYYLP
jgi:hypothetical protein